MIAFDWRTEVAPGHTRGHDGSLAIGGVAVDALARAYGTPLLAFDLGVFDEAVETFAGACAPHGIEIAYAAKALIFIALARRLIATPLHIDVCSLGELRTVEAAGVTAERITVHGCGKSDELLQAVAAARAGTIVVDGIDELARLAALSTVAPVSVVLRVNAGIEAHTHAFVRTAGEDTKFGLDPTELPEAFARIAGAGSLRLSGLHSHIGSQIYDAAPFVANVEALATFAAAARSAGLHAKQWILGGGFGVETRPGEPRPLDIPALMRAIAKAADAASARANVAPPRLGIEPGRALAARAGTSLYRVMAVKREGARRFIVVDGGLADNPRPSLYDAYHHPMLAWSQARAANAQATVCGRSCENDVLVEAQLPADIVPGDLLVLTTTGAYTYSMASNYNRFGRPPVVMVREGRHALGVRGETDDDVLRLDVREPVDL